MKYIIQGFILGIAYVAPIGMQNLYVINNAINKDKKRAYMVALATIFFDITLALACFYGIGVILEKFNSLKLGILLIGAVAVTYIGISLIKIKEVKNEHVDMDKPMSKVIVTCLLVTWVNPQAIIDGSLLLGGFKASLPPMASKLFIGGVSLASFSWFMGITTIASVFKHAINNKVIKYINIICGSVLIYYGLKLAYEFLSMMNIVK